MHPALMLDLQRLAEAWGLLSVVAVIVWSVDRVRDDYETFGARWERHTPEPSGCRLRPRLYDWARDEVA